MFAASISAAIPGKSRAAPAFFWEVGMFISFQDSRIPCLLIPSSPWAPFPPSSGAAHGASFPIPENLEFLCCAAPCGTPCFPNDKLGKKGVLLCEFPNFYGFSSLIPKSFLISKISQSQRILVSFALPIFQRSQNLMDYPIFFFFFAEQGEWRT